MLPLYLLAAHLLGDFVLQTRWQADGKLRDGSLGGLRMRHVAAYCLPFVPVAVYASPDGWRAAQFMLGLYGLHVLTDSRRFYSTLGDVIAWRLAVPDEVKIEAHARPHPHPMMDITMRPSSADGLRLPTNPWPAIPLMIDQTLHVCQLALLGGLFLT